MSGEVWGRHARDPACAWGGPARDHRAIHTEAAGPDYGAHVADRVLEFGVALCDAVSMRRRASQTRPSDERGQGLVEFALLMPILMILFMGIIEVALMFNAYVGVNRASQSGAHTAATMGNQAGADCLILTEIESDVTVPNSAARINWVDIERTSLAGNKAYLKQRWTRTGVPFTCTLPDLTSTTVPYRLDVNTYPEDQRCPALAGCGAAR